MSGGPTYTYPSNTDTHQNFDTSAGAITANLDGSPTNGERQGLKDVGLALTTNALTVSSGGKNIEYPPGTIATINLVFNGGALGIGLTWQWFSAYNTWFIVNPFP